MLPLQLLQGQTVVIWCELGTDHAGRKMLKSRHRISPWAPLC